ncbi:alpha/beta fold hydrolase [Ferviditalea candida]|uniref:Alpha/beta hydrolase n=1 Tax=Ferviditalea candida TaxID=3108399 RepID=A0ABU5ZCX5_9BACL|nr:alpha/beta hydrolase [Paenibacillaceae bacterium T2]
MMHGMKQETYRVNGIRLNAWTGGNGKPLVLLHGYPQTAVMWRKIIPKLSENFSVVCPDLRGYGDSEKPRSGYDKRTMALDIKLLMETLGYRQFSVVGHDRGGRVGHRLALDHPDSVDKLCVLDIVPTHTVFQQTTKELAAAYWHWFFFLVPDLPELMIGAKPEEFLRSAIFSLGCAAGAIEEEAMQEYIRTFKMPGTIRAVLEDYRAAATVDFGHDEQDLGRKLTCPVLALWGEYGKMHQIFDVLGTWKEKAQFAEGRPLHSGHFIPEEAPEALLEELERFL